MELHEYRQAYYNLETAASQTRVIALSAGESLKEFPFNLPAEAREAVGEFFGVLIDQLKQAKQAKDAMHEDAPDDTVSPRTEEHVPEVALSPFTLPMLNLFMAGAFSKKDLIGMDFEGLLYGQELVMVLAHLDAFMVDSLRTMCHKEPRLLRRNKTMTWDSILERGSWQDLINGMIEEYVYEFGWKSIREKVQYLQSKHGLSIKTPLSDLDALDEAEKIRNIIVHNGSRVSQEYLERTHRKDIKVGDVIPITSEYSDSINHKVRMLGSDIFVAVAEKFFAANSRDFSGIWLRKP